MACGFESHFRHHQWEHFTDKEDWMPVLKHLVLPPNTKECKMKLIIIFCSLLLFTGCTTNPTKDISDILDIYNQYLTTK